LAEDAKKKNLMVSITWFASLKIKKACGMDKISALSLFVMPDLLPAKDGIVDRHPVA
jgi:hypothetical protein